MRRTAEKVKNLFVKRPSLLITDSAYQMASLQHAPDVSQIIWEAKKAFQLGISPEPIAKGNTRTFFLKDSEGQKIAIFKGDYYLHEVAAYRLDHRKFAGVPQTAITTLFHPSWGGSMTGSCQYFVPQMVTATHISHKDFHTLSAASIRRIATLDLRVMNGDRHSSNLLVDPQTKSVIPIDHAFIFTHDLKGVHLDWIKWAQAETPFTESELSYISWLDAEADRHMLLDELRMDEKTVNRLFVATILLQLGALRKLTPAAIGNVFSQRKECGSHFEVLMGALEGKKIQNWLSFSRTVYDEVQRTLDLYEQTSRESANAATHC